MKQHSGVVLAFSVSLGLCCPSETADWTTVRPGITTEAELVAAFGSPDEVVATFPWTEWSARWKKRPLTSRHFLRYDAQSSGSPLLVGPGGKADDVEVAISDGKVGAVSWHYGGPSARAAAASLRRDPGMSFRSTEAASQAAKVVPGGTVFAEVGPGDSTVKVLFDLK